LDIRKNFRVAVLLCRACQEVQSSGTGLPGDCAAARCMLGGVVPTRRCREDTLVCAAHREAQFSSTGLPGVRTGM